MATDYVVRFTGQDNVSGTINQIKKNLEDVGSSSTKLDQIKQQFEKVEQSTAPLKRKLRDLKTLMAEMNFNGLSNTDVFNKMAQQAGAYADALGDASTATNVFANDNFKLEAVTQGLTGLAGAASVATGVMGLLGTENQQVAQAIMKVQSVLSILNGVQAISNILNKDSAFMLRLKQIRLAANTTATKSQTTALNANTIAENINATANKKGTATQNAWNVAKAIAKALCGDFTGLLLVGAGALLTYTLATGNSTEKLEDQAKATDKAKEAMDKYRNNVASSAGNLIGKYKLLQNEWNNLRTVAAKTDFIEKQATEIQNLGGKVKNLSDAENFFIKNTDNVVAALNARAQAMAAQSMITEAYEQYFKTISDADNSVAGGGYYNVYQKGGGALKNTQLGTLSDEAKAAGVTISDLEVSTYTYSSTYGTVTNTYYSETQKVVDKINAYRQKKARETNKNIKSDAEKTLNKTVSFATDVINKSNATIKKNGLDFNQQPKGSTGGTSNTNNIQQPSYQAGSLAAEEAELQRLQDILKNTKFVSDKARQTAIQAVREQAAKVTTMKMQLKWEVEPLVDMSDNSINGLTNQIQALDNQIQETTDAAKRKELVLQRNVKIQLKEKMEIAAGLKDNDEEAPEVKTIRELYNELKNKAYDIQQDFDDGLINKEDAQSKLAEINAQIAKLGGKPIKLEFQTNLDKINEQFTKGVSTISSVDNVVNSIKNLSKNLKDGADAWTVFVSAVNIASNVMGAITTAMELYNTLSTIFTAKKVAEGVAATTASTAISTAEGIKAAADTASVAPSMAATAAAKGQEAAMLDLAAASYFAAHAYIPFAGFGIASGFVAGMMGIMAAQKAASSALSTFADGGIISGSTFHGDNMLARVNSGEMILNQKQQANLFRALDGGISGGGAVVSEVKIKGSDLYLALKNYKNKMSKIK